MYHNYPIKYISWSSEGNKVLPNSLVNANDEAIVKVYEKQTGQNAQKLRKMRLLGFFLLMKMCIEEEKPDSVTANQVFSCVNSIHNLFVVS